MIKLDEVKYFYDLAVDEKRDYTTVFNQILGYVDPSYQIDDIEPSTISFKNIEPVISIEVTKTVNFVINSILSRENKFANLVVDTALYKAKNKREIGKSELQKMNIAYENLTNDAYAYLSSSNFYQETSKAIRECILLGTGAFHIIETDNVRKPFTFRYVPLNNLFYYEDAFGNPNHTFKRYYRKSINTLKMLYGDYEIFDIKYFHDNEKYIEGIDIIECVIPICDKKGKTTYETFIVDSNFDCLIAWKKSEYNHTVVFRFSQLSEQVLGTGLGLQALQAFEDLVKYKKERNEQVKRILDPALKLTGDKSLLQQASLKAGGRTYGGNGENNQIDGQVNGFSIEPIINNPTLIPIENDIALAKQEIREVFMSNPLTNEMDYKNRREAETNARIKAFTDRWSSAFQILESELLQPMIIIPAKILIDKGMIDYDIEDSFDLTKFKYVNNLTKSINTEDVNNTARAIQASANLAQIAERSGLSADRVQDYVLNKYEVDESLRLSDDEKEELIKQAQQQAVQQQQMAQAQNQQAQSSLREANANQINQQTIAQQ